MTIHLFHGFIADRRTSMDIYAYRLYEELSKSNQDVSLFRPQSWLERFTDSKLIMRYLRYLEYPRQVQHHCQAIVSDTDVCHVLDHGYAHLLKPLSKYVEAGRRINHAKTCVTVHDMIPILAWRGRFGASYVGRKPLLALHSMQNLSNASKLFAVSSNTANDLHKELGIPAKRIEVIPAPLGEQFLRCTESEIDAFRQRFAMDSAVFWILVSGSEFYKNHAAVLAVFRLLQKRKLPVKILKTGIGGISPTSPLSALNSGEIMSISVDTNELATLYSSVDCVLFPSIYEGFGYPVAEALACGTPVVCSNAASLPEVGGDVAHYCEPHDYKGMADVLEQLLNQGDVADVRTRGPKQVAPFRASRVADSLRQQYLSL